MTRAAFVLAGLLIAVPHAQVRQQAPLVTAPPDTIERWLAAVNLHTPGERDEPVTTVAAWPDNQLTFAFQWASEALRILDRWPFAEAVRAAPVSRLGLKTPDDARRFMKRGAILHADIAMLARDIVSESRRPARGSGGSVLMLDGEALGLEGNPIHWSFGRLLINSLQPRAVGAAPDRIPPNPNVDPFVRHWFRATTAYLAHTLNYSEELSHTSQGLSTISDDPVLLLLAGAMREHFGSSVVQAAIRTVALPAGMQLMIGSAGDELNRARRLLERAIAAEPSSAEAHIRLGRVLSYRDEHVEAVRELQRGRDLAVEPRWKYFAALFLGSELEQLKRPADARDAYARATAIYPRAQSPRLALSRLAAELGDREAAAAANRAILSLPSDLMARDDPWWSYQVRPRAYLDRLLAEYYEVARAVR